MITMLVDTCPGDRNVDDEKNTIVRSASSFKEPRDEILLYSFFSLHSFYGDLFAPIANMLQNKSMIVDSRIYVGHQASTS
jgi:hypothetical protein